MKNVNSTKFTDRWGTEGEIRVGWASWDKGDYNSGSVKWAYNDQAGKISRGSPEVPIDVLYAMVKFVKENETFFPDEDREFIEVLKSIT
jgi:hypothetical protein